MRCAMSVSMVTEGGNLRIPSWERFPRSPPPSGMHPPKGVPAPVVPPRPKGDLGKAWEHLSFEHWDVTIERLPEGGPAPAITGGGEETQFSVSSLACAACPVSSFSSLSN